MNKPIEELLLKAGFSETYGLQEKERLNKFAELIVRECINIVERDDGATELGELLLDHFFDWS